MEMAAVVQYILTAVQSFGSPDCYNKSLMTILGLTGVLFWEHMKRQIIVFSEDNSYLSA